MKSKHTRGPWTVGRDESGEVVVESPDGILCMPYFWVWPECSDPLPGDPEANARLMAASPELLDVACRLAEWGRGGHDHFSLS